MTWFFFVPDGNWRHFVPFYLLYLISLQTVSLVWDIEEEWGEEESLFLQPVFSMKRFTLVIMRPVPENGWIIEYLGHHRGSHTARKRHPFRSCRLILMKITGHTLHYHPFNICIIGCSINTWGYKKYCENTTNLPQVQHFKKLRIVFEEHVRLKVLKDIFKTVA